MLLVFAGLAALRPGSELRQRLELYGQGAAEPTTLEQVEQQESFGTRVVAPLLLGTMRAFGSLMPNKRLAKIRSRLQLAGSPGGLTAAHFVGIQIWTTIIMGGMAVLYLFNAPRPTPMTLLMLVVWVVAAFKLPDIWLSRRIKQRQQELTNTLPDGLDMLTIAVEAGLSFDQAAGELVSRWNNELSREFRRVLYEIGVGTSRREALEHFAERTGVRRHQLVRGGGQPLRGPRHQPGHRAQRAVAGDAHAPAPARPGAGQQTAGEDDDSAGVVYLPGHVRGDPRPGDPTDYPCVQQYLANTRSYGGNSYL